MKKLFIYLSICLVVPADIIFEVGICLLLVVSLGENPCHQNNAAVCFICLHDAAPGDLWEICSRKQ